MTTNNINHVLFKNYEAFLGRLSPVVDDEMLRSKLKAPLGDLLLDQRETDRIQAQVGGRKPFQQVLRKYFEQFLVKDTVDFKRLKYGTAPFEKNLLRRIGEENLAYLKLLIEIHDSLKEKRPGQGLIFGDAS